MSEEEGSCVHCHSGCLKCAGQHHRATTPAKHYHEPMIKLPKSLVITLLNKCVEDDIRVQLVECLDEE